MEKSQIQHITEAIALMETVKENVSNEWAKIAAEMTIVKLRDKIREIQKGETQNAK